MCGIVASYKVSRPQQETKEARQQLEDALYEAAQTLYHRGPDDKGAYVSEDARVGLGHARLSIIDVEGGHQPLHSIDGTVHAVVNGELYDYAKLRAELEALGAVFQTSSDSELAIHLYKIRGENMFKYLRGEFAFVIYDSERDVILAAKDRFGIKPLFYTVVDGRILVASEIKAFVPLGWKAEWDVHSVVNMGDYNDDRTVFKGVFKVPAGHFLTYNRSGRLRSQPYWDQEYSDRHVEDKRSLEELVVGVRERLIDAVKTRLRSDVPLAIFLSGGLDSCTIAGIAAHLLRQDDPNAKLDTFTLSFPGRPEHDEGPIAQRMAESIGASSHMVAPTEEELIKYFEKSVYHCEMPIATFHCAGKMLLSEYVRDRGFKVVLTGEGSDENFAGYTYLLLDYLRSVDEQGRNLDVPLPSAAELQAILTQFESRGFPQDHVSLSDVSFTDAKFGRELMGGISLHRIWAAQGAGPEIFSTKALEQFGPVDPTRTIAESLRLQARQKINDGIWHPLNSSMYTISHTLLSHWILNGLGDRPEMAGSIEGRPPFLDHVLSEYAQHLPPSAKVLPRPIPQEDGSRKWEFTEKFVLREAAKPFITEEIYGRRKTQYNALAQEHTDKGPDYVWPLRELLTRRLTKENIERLGFINWEYIEALLNNYVNSPGTPADGGLDRRARILLCVSSYVILQENFSIPSAQF